MGRLLKKPHCFLAASLVVIIAIGWDSCRDPSRQLTSRAYVQVVQGYQGLTRPWLGNYVQCRYRPSCSEYSIIAVQRYGIRRGLWLTAGRIARCRPSVPAGTYDPVP